MELAPSPGTAGALGRRGGCGAVTCFLVVCCFFSLSESLSSTTTVLGIGAVFSTTWLFALRPGTGGVTGRETSAGGATKGGTAMGLGDAGRAAVAGELGALTADAGAASTCDGIGLRAAAATAGGAAVGGACAGVVAKTRAAAAAAAFIGTATGGAGCAPLSTFCASCEASDWGTCGGACAEAVELATTCGDGTVFTLGPETVFTFFAFGLSGAARG